MAAILFLSKRSVERLSFDSSSASLSSEAIDVTRDVFSSSSYLESQNKKKGHGIRHKQKKNIHDHQKSYVLNERKLVNKMIKNYKIHNHIQNHIQLYHESTVDLIHSPALNPSILATVAAQGGRNRDGSRSGYAL